MTAGGSGTDLDLAAAFRSNSRAPPAAPRSLRTTVPQEPTATNSDRKHATMATRAAPAACKALPCGIARVSGLSLRPSMQRKRLAAICRADTHTAPAGPGKLALSLIKASSPPDAS
jgi:hypothetical protein